MLTVAAQVLLLPLHHQGHQGGGLHPRARRHAPHTPSQVNIFGKSPNIFLGLTINQDPPGHSLVRAHGVQPRDGRHGHLVLQVLCTVYHTLYRTVLYCTLYCTVLYCRVDGRSKQVTAYHVRVTGGIDFIYLWMDRILPTSK